MSANSKPERILGWIVLIVLLGGCLLVIRPFLSALLLAIVLCFASWPAYKRILKLLAGQRTLASLLMVLLLTIGILAPLVVIGFTLTESTKKFGAAAQEWLDKGPPPPPEWLEKFPVVGRRATEGWRYLKADRIIQPAGAILLKIAGTVGRGLLELTLSILVAFFLFRDGDTVFGRLTAAVDRIGGERGRHMLNVAREAIRGIVYGVLATAIAQGFVAGIGLYIAGVPAAAALGLLTFFLSFAPIGPPMVWLSASIWLFSQGRIGWGIFMLAWGMAVSSIDNVIKPLIISRGSRLPFLLIFIGVMGGVAAFGFIGVFLGPPLLAVGYRVVEEWLSDGHEVKNS